MLTARPVPNARRTHKSKGVTRGPRLDRVDIGFVPMIDCAPLIAAKELGLFAKHGVDVTLRKEIGWATIREKLLHGELQAAHAPASMGFVIRCGISSLARPCVTGFVLSLNGSAITLSKELHERGARDSASLARLIAEDRQKRTYTFGAVLEYSTQNYNLRAWLRAGGIDPDRDVRIQIIPSPLIHEALIDGHIDGFCVAEPWNSVAVAADAGWIATSTADLAPLQPEKVLLALEEFAEGERDTHCAILAALIEASIFCEATANRPELVRMLAQPEYVGVPESILARSLLAPQAEGIAPGRGGAGFISYHDNEASVPTRKKGRVIYDYVKAQPASRDCQSLKPDIIGRIFREDLYREAEALVPPRAPSAQRSSRPVLDLSSMTQLPITRLAFAT